LRILYVITKSEIGGAQTHLLDVLRHFAREHEVTVAVGDDGFLAREAAGLGVRTVVLRHLVHPISPREDARGVRELLAVMRRAQPDLVHLHSSKAGTIGRLAARILRTPVVFTAHGWPFSRGTSLSRRVVALPAEWLMARITDGIINVSDWDRNLALRYRVGRPEIHEVVHNGVRELPRVHRESHESFVVTMVARFDHQKAQPLLIRALAQLPQGVRVKFLGDGPLRPACEALARDLAVHQRVSFVGNSGRVAEELAESDAFALISHYEGFPISILEAMRAGLPIVASRVGGVPEAVIDGQNGLLVDNDIDGIARALEALRTDREARRRMGESSRQSFEARFTSDAMMQKLERVYRRVLERSGNASSALSLPSREAAVVGHGQTGSAPCS